VAAVNASGAALTRARRWGGRAGRQVGDEAALRAAFADDTVDEVVVTGPITLTQRIDIYRVVTVRGAGCSTEDAACTQTVDGGGSTRLFRVQSGAVATFANLKLRNVRPALRRPPP